MKLVEKHIIKKAFSVCSNIEFNHYLIDFKLIKNKNNHKLVEILTLIGLLATSL